MIQFLKAYILLLSILIFGNSNLAHAQVDQEINSKIDSLKTMLNHEDSNNDEKTQTSLKLLRIYNDINYDTAAYYGNLALNLSLEDNKDSLAIATYCELGNLFYLMNDYDNCYKQVNAGIKHSMDSGIDVHLGDLYNINASAMQEQGLLEEALINNLKNKDFCIAKKDSFGLARAFIGLSYVYYRIKDYDKVFESAEEVIKISEDIDYTVALFYGYNMLGGAYETVKKHDESLMYYHKAYDIADSLNSPIRKATALVNIASEESRRTNFNEAIESYTTAKNIYDRLGDKRGEHEVIGSLGEMYLYKENFREAIKLCKESYLYSKENDYLSEQEVNCECLYKAYKNIGDSKNALFYHEKYKMLSDSVFSAERKSELTNIQLTHQFNQEKERIEIEQKEKELILQNKNTRSRFVALLFSLISLIGIFGFLWIRRKNQLIEKQKEKLEEINNTKDKLFAIIGHDLKRPAMALKGITSKVKYLLDNKDYERLNQFGNQIEENANSFNSIVNNLLHWALLQKDVMPYNPKEMSLNDIINHVLNVYQSEIQSKEISIKVNVPNDLKIYSDEVALNAVLSNLLDNAIKFTDDKGYIEIEGIPNGEKTNINIKDSGKGLSKTQLKKIFSLVKNKTKIGTKGELGTGLGLHLVYELVKLNKGEISVSSEVEKGTKFQLQFPSKLI